MRRRIDAKRTFALSVAAGLIGLLGPASAQGATQVGQAFLPSASPGQNTTFLQVDTPPGTPSYTFPTAGVVTAWSFTAGANPPQIKLKIGRYPSGRIVGESPLTTVSPNSVNTFATRISVTAGDLLGLYRLGDGSENLAAVSGGTVADAAGDVAPGTTGGFAQLGNLTLAVSAVLEPDADSDGFGDETQDGCPSDGAVQGPCPDTVPPDTTITSQPKTKTKKKQATFSFSSSEPNSSFECSLNGAPFAPCTSPLAVKGKKGKNHFEVRAKDAAGNVDPTPATFDWKVKRKN